MEQNSKKENPARNYYPPGSDEALAHGCRCPILDNAHGLGYMGGAKDEEGHTVYVVSVNCPLHGLKMRKTRVVNCKKEPYDVYIGRPSKWGNPYRIGPDGSREEVIEKYRRHLLNQPELLADLDELRGKVLGCWCAPQACHGDVLVELLEKKGSENE